MDPSDYSFFDVEIADGIATIWLNGPDPNNIYLPADNAEFRRLARDLREDDEIRVAVITGRGETFSLGIDRTSRVAAGTQGMGAVFDTVNDFMKSFLDLDKPIVVALNGVALHQALTLVMLADIIVADRSAQFRDVHVPLGLVSATGPFLWPASMGLMKAKRYILTGEWITAEEAERLGLVSEVVDDGRSVIRALEYARLLADYDPFAVRHTKRALNEWLKSMTSSLFSQALAVELLGMAIGPPIPPPEGYRVPPTVASPDPRAT